MKWGSKEKQRQWALRVFITLAVDGDCVCVMATTMTTNKRTTERRLDVEEGIIFHVLSNKPTRSK